MIARRHPVIARRHPVLAQRHPMLARRQPQHPFEGRIRLPTQSSHFFLTQRLAQLPPTHAF